jgi:hypothetical protein
MHDEYLSRAKKHGVTCEVWSPHCRTTEAPQLLLVAMECSAWEQFKLYLNSLIILGQLARVVVDESHLLLKHEGFRECVDMLQHFGQMAISIILMTATLPSSIEGRLFEKVGRRVYRVLRRNSERPEIAHRMIPLETPDSDFEDVVAQRIEEQLEKLKGRERILLFCNSRAECDRMAKKLGWRAYHSDIPIADRSHHMQEWLAGEKIGLSCTSMLNCCLDYPAVRIVVHLRIPRDAIDYCQGVGRASRDGSPGWSFVFFNINQCRKITGEDPFGRAAMHETLKDGSTCRRLRIALFLDGTAIPCTMLPNGQLCDVCERQLIQAPPSDGPMVFPTHLLPRQLPEVVTFGSNVSPLVKSTSPIDPGQALPEKTHGTQDCWHAPIASINILAFMTIQISQHPKQVMAIILSWLKAW